LEYIKDKVISKDFLLQNKGFRNVDNVISTSLYRQGQELQEK
jgi:hypothetical protein